MSEERNLILEMVAEGKITPEEAEMLLQAVDESERSARLAATETVRGAEPGPEAPQGLGQRIERVVNDSLQGLDHTLRGLEEKLQRKLAERMAGKWHEKVDHAARIIKVGVSIDRETVQRQERLTIPAQPGDRLVLENRVGDVTVIFADVPEIAVDLRITAWGADRADAEERAAATRAILTRNGSDVLPEVMHPSISGTGVIVLKDTRLDYTIRAPQGTHLQIRNKVGDLRVEAGDQVGNWDLQTKVGDVDLKVGDGANVQHQLTTKVGAVQASLNSPAGGAAGTIQASVKTGDIRLHY